MNKIDDLLMYLEDTSNINSLEPKLDYTLSLDERDLIIDALVFYKEMQVIN